MTHLVPTIRGVPWRADWSNRTPSPVSANRYARPVRHAGSRVPSWGSSWGATRAWSLCGSVRGTARQSQRWRLWKQLSASHCRELPGRRPDVGLSKSVIARHVEKRSRLTADKPIAPGNAGTPHSAENLGRVRSARHSTIRGHLGKYTALTNAEAWPFARQTDVKFVNSAAGQFPRKRFRKGNGIAQEIVQGLLDAGSVLRRAVIPSTGMDT